MAYCPRGPIVDWIQSEQWQPIVKDMVERIGARGAFFIKIDPGIEIPDVIENDDQIDKALAGQALLDSGWILSGEQVQFRNTLTLDLTQDEEALLAGMKQKTRYNIRLAGRKGVSVREGTLKDLDLLYQMYAETSHRDGFVIRPKEYYRDAWGSFIERGQAAPLIAEVEGEAVAALIVYRFGRTAYYLYGMSRDAHREMMPNHLLQWEAIQWAKAAGCNSYDFWGAPHKIEEGEPMYGVYRFKLGFGADLVRTPGAWDYPIKPFVYRLYTTFMPFILAMMRTFSRARTRSQVQDI
jgi:lipid II:glycine glycyltransferase (peptidoglycan interpeptide bridge formation enzyme)